MKELGYNLYSSARGARGGGVAILAKKALRVVPIKPQLKPTSFECIQATIEGGNLQKTRLVVVYRPPSSSKKDFLAEFEEYLSSMNGLNGHPIILGDFNIHTEDDDDHTSNLFRDLLMDERWTQHVEDPTHESGGTLDLVITRDDDTSPRISAVEVAKSSISDHYAVTFCLHVGKPILRERKVVLCRNMKKATVEVLSLKIDESPLMAYPRPTTLEGLLNLYNNTLRAIRDEVAPLK